MFFVNSSLSFDLTPGVKSASREPLPSRVAVERSGGWLRSSQALRSGTATLEGPLLFRRRFLISTPLLAHPRDDLQSPVHFLFQGKRIQTPLLLPQSFLGRSTDLPAGQHPRQRRLGLLVNPPHPPVLLFLALQFQAGVKVV